MNTRAVDRAKRILSLWLSGPGGRAQVQGHAAKFSDVDGAYVLIWEPERGLQVELRVRGVDEASARAIAESVRPASDAEWTDLREQSARLEEARTGAPPDNAVHGQLAGGAEVSGWLGDNGDLCYGMRDSRLCTSAETDVLGVSPTNVDGELRWDVPAAVGVAPEGTASIDGGEVTLGERVEGGRLFVWEFSEGEMPDSLTFRDAGGNEITTSEVHVS